MYARNLTVFYNGGMAFCMKLYHVGNLNKNSTNILRSQNLKQAFSQTRNLR